ncbi:MAG: tetratricopeptide repeat protein, partial [Vicinamibacteria bacterium]
VLVFGASVLVYSGTLGNGFVYDDRFVVEQNSLVQNLEWWGLVSTGYWGELVDAGLYRPLTLLSFGLNRALGPSPFGFHLANLILHGLAAVLTLLVARTVGLSRGGSACAALLFALHPPQSEAVNAIVGRAEILAFSFAIGSLLLFARNRSPALVGATFFLGLLSKESAAFALPLFFLHRREARSFVPLALALAAYGTLRFAALDGLGISGREIGFLDNPLAEAGFATRLLTAPVLVLQYAKLVAWPRVLSADYSFDQIPIPVTFLEARVLLGVALLAIAVFLSARRGALGFAVFAFFVPLLGFLHLLFPLGTLFGERLLYLPMLGAALAFGLAIDALLKRSVWLGGLVLATVLVASAARVWSRNLDWRDNETLFRRTIETAPRSARGHFLLGAELLEKRNFAEAAEWFEKGLSIYPNHLGARMSLGEALLAAGEPDRAEVELRRALALAPKSEDVRRAVLEAALARGRDRARAEDFEGARESFERALALDQRDPSAWNYLGLVSERQGRLGEARRHYERALAHDPDHVPALLNLASVSLSAGELASAEEIYRRVLVLAKDSYEAYNGLGIALARQGRRGEAAAAFEKAIALEPGLET